ncbi:RNA-directed DNA polymerase, eukaryota, reverse transcriptase zinc-binding domain protein [Tanacetum coccineum]
MPDICITALDRLWSDHTPILFHILKSYFGLIPFKLYNSWLSRDGFDDIIKATWSSLENNNNDGRILKSHEKFWSLKASIKQCKIFSFAKNIFDILDPVPDEVDTHKVPEFDNVDTPAPRPSARVLEQRIVSFDLSGCDSESKSYIIEQVFIRMSVKDIVRCMIVCKSWGSFIGDPGFRRAYENMSGILITKDKSKIFSFAKNIFDILDQVPDEVDTHQVREFLSQESKIFSFAKNIFDLLDQVPYEVDTHQVPEFDNVDTPAPRPSARVPEKRIVCFDLSGCNSESKSIIIELVFINKAVKDIVRCIIVCKSWGRFIGDPGFRRAYENMSGILITKDKSKIFSFAKNIFDLLDQVPDEVDTHQVPE